MSIHDSGYKRLFSNRTIFQQLIQTFVDEPWVADLDFSQAETLDKSFVNEAYQAYESDLIYRVKLHGRDLYIYVLLEFQSTVDRFMALRVLNYVTQFYLELVASRQHLEKLPAVFPIVLYNGDRAWRAATRMSELIELEPSLGRYALGFEYLLLAEQSVSREQLLRIRNIVSTLFLAEAHYDVELLIEELVALFEREPDKQAASLLINWFRQLARHEYIERGDFEQFEEVYQSTEEVQSMLIKALERERQQYIEQGIEQGIERGIEQSQQEIVRTMSAHGFDALQIAEVTGIPAEEVLDFLAKRDQ